MNNKVIDIIIEFVKAAQSGEAGGSNRIECIDDGVTYAIGNSKYLLGQIIRQYSLPWDHYFVSEKAKELWENITDKNMGDFWYRNKVYCTKDNSVTISRYTGASKTPHEPEKLNVGDWFYYREVFHDEHVVTINDVIDELLALKEVTKDKVISILDKIYICRMLKSEDRDLYPKKHRSSNVDEVLEGPYKEHNIKVLRGYFG